MLRFVFAVVPTAALATAVAVGVSRGKSQPVATADGDFLRDLQLASTASIELAPAGQPVTTISAIEAPPSSAPERSVRPKRNPRGTRAVRSRAPTVAAAPEAEIAESTDDAETSTTTDLAAAAAEETAAAPAEGGVALPRPTAIPVSFPTGGGDGGTYDPGPGTVIRGGGVFGDHCQIHGGRGGRVYGPPIYRQPRGITLGDRIRGAQGERERTSSLGDRIRGGQSSGGRSASSISDRIRQASSSRPRSEGSSGTRRGSLGDRIRAARGRG